MNPNKTADLDYRRLVRESKRVDGSRPGRGVRIALLSDAATQQFVPVFKTLFHENDLGVELYEAAFDAIELEVINSSSGLYAFRPEFVFLMNSTQAFRSRYYEHGAEPELDRIQRIWSALEAHLNCSIVQCNFPLPFDRPFGQFDLKMQNTLYTATQALNARIAQAAADKPNVLVCDLEAVASSVGRRHWFDDRLWDLSKTFCNLEYLPLAAQAMVDLVLAKLGKIVKCVVLDLDNTLWGGVVGDVGHAGIQVGAHGDGEAFHRFQKYLLSLKKRGVLLAVCSKNGMEAAVAPFEQNGGMVLKREDISVFVANWDNKADNLSIIRSELGIGYDSMVFIDDNPFERNLVRNFLPEVIVPEMPEDPSDYVRVISDLNLFETTSFSAEDAARSTLYKQEADRREAQRSFTDVSDYLRSLDMQIAVGRFDGEKIGRIVQLLLRSNQFNVTTHRYNESECVAMMRNVDNCIPLHASLSDRFGDHGLISIVVAWIEGDTLRISDWLMSCRVLGRGVEQYLMNHVFHLARDRGLMRVTGEYIPTAKNGLVRDFWSQFGFENSDKSIWEMQVADYKPHTVWIRPGGTNVEEETDPIWTQQP